jgi:uncharacterized protein YkwD
MRHVPRARHNAGPAQQAALVAVLAAVGLIWPVAGDNLRAALTPDRDGCPHSSDLPDPGQTTAARAAVLCLVNQHRAEHRLAALVEHPALQAAAQAHAEDMGCRDFYSHENPDGIGPHQRITSAGYRGRATGENIHWGVGINATPAQIVDGWMDSPGHRANILRREFTYVGTGVAYDAPELLTDGPVGVYVHNFGG